MKTVKHQLMIAYEDYETLNAYAKGTCPVPAFDRSNAAQLQEELRKAILVKRAELPKDVVRLNSKVVIKEGNKNKLLDLTVVLPEKADIKQRKISIFAPIGTALIGFRQGEKVKWNVPSGKKTFTILKVDNPDE